MSDNIAKMNDKQLRTEVQLLRDELAIMKRKYEDILYNLDTDNFSSRFVKEQGDMKTAIEITAEGIKTKVSKDELQSEISQVADEISLSVSALGQEISSLSVSTNGLKSRVNNVEDGEFNGYTLFEQTGSKFKFTGNVEITGNAVVGGVLTGSSIQDADKTTKLSMGSAVGAGDLNLFRLANGTEYNTFSIYDDFSAIDLKVFGETILYSTGDTTYPTGIWDFRQCDEIIGISGGSGGVAVFG